MSQINKPQNNIQDQVRDLLKGKSLAIIGGDPRPGHAARIKSAFQLKNVVWIPTRPSDPSPRRFKPTISRRQVDLVIALHGLLRHQHIRDVHDLCRQHGVPVVSCWRSPNPSSLAAAVFHKGSQFQPDMSRLVDVA